jgi:hypothetical protein
MGSFINESQIHLVKITTNTGETSNKKGRFTEANRTNRTRNIRRIKSPEVCVPRAFRAVMDRLVWLCCHQDVPG